MTQTTVPHPESGEPWAAAALSNLLSRRAAPMPAGTWAADAAPGVIALTTGVPDPECLPYEELLEATTAVLRGDNRMFALEYGGNLGYPGLRELVASRVDHQPGLGFDVRNVTLTNGGSQGLHLLLDTLIDPGDTIVMEVPAWGGMIRQFRAAAARIEEVSMDDHGIVVADLDETLSRLTAEGRKPKLVYTIPTFQNPMGVTSTLERRKQIIEVAARHRVIILEDDPYCDMRFRGDPVPSFLTLAGGDGVIRCGSFSKNIATGLRVGWIQADRSFIDATQRMRLDNGTSPFLSRVIEAYIQAGHFEPHIAKASRSHGAKCDALLSALEETCSRFATWTRPEGGFFMWVTLPDGIDMAALEQAAIAEGVQYIPGPAFFAKGGGAGSLRLCYSYHDEATLSDAARRLARAIERVRP